MGITEQGYRTGSSHHNYNGRITQVVVDALRDLNEEGVVTAVLVLCLVSAVVMSTICRYEKRVSYATAKQSKLGRPIAKPDPIICEKL